MGMGTERGGFCELMRAESSAVLRSGGACGCRSLMMALQSPILIDADRERRDGSPEVLSPVSVPREHLSVARPPSTLTPRTAAT